MFQIIRKTTDLLHKTQKQHRKVVAAVDEVIVVEEGRDQGGNEVREEEDSHVRGRF